MRYKALLLCNEISGVYNGLSFCEFPFKAPLPWAPIPHQDS